MESKRGGRTALGTMRVFVLFLQNLFLRAGLSLYEKLRMEKLLSRNTVLSFKTRHKKAVISDRPPLFCNPRALKPRVENPYFLPAISFLNIFSNRKGEGQA